MLLLVSRCEFPDGEVRFSKELVFKKTNKNLYEYNSGILKYLHKNNLLTNIPKWVSSNNISFFINIFNKKQDWFSLVHESDCGFKEYTGDFIQYIGKIQLDRNSLRDTKTYSKTRYNKLMFLSESDFLIGGTISFCFENNFDTKQVVLEDVVFDIFSKNQKLYQINQTKKKFWLLDLNQFKNLESMTALTSEDFDNLLYPNKRKTNKPIFLKKNASLNHQELDYKKRAREFYLRNYYKQAIKKSDIVNLSKFNYEVSNLKRESFGDCHYILEFDSNLEYVPGYLEALDYGYSDCYWQTYERDTYLSRKYISQKNGDPIVNYRYHDWKSSENRIYVDGENSYSTIFQNLDTLTFRYKGDRARKLVNKRIKKESSDISNKRRSGGWKESSKKRKQWMK